MFIPSSLPVVILNRSITYSFFACCYRTELTKAQQELTEVQELYVKVCQEKDQLEQDAGTGKKLSECLYSIHLNPLMLRDNYFLSRILSIHYEPHTA